MAIASAVLLALIAAVLVVPLTVEVSGEASTVSGTSQLQTRVEVLGFSRILRAGRSSGSARKPPARRRRATPRRKRLRAALNPVFIRGAAKLLVRLAKLAQPDALRLRASVGLDDPAATGMLFAAWSVLAPVPGFRHCHVHPDFTAEVLEVTGSATWTRNLAQLAWPLLPFLASVATWRVILGRR
jgi:hypothetical protein